MLFDCYRFVGQQVKDGTAIAFLERVFAAQP